MSKIHPYYQSNNYNDIFDIDKMPDQLHLGDHLGGFDQQRKNHLLDHIHEKIKNDSILITWDQILPDSVKKIYPNIDWKLELWQPIWNGFVDYNVHPVNNFKNFVCSFNGHGNVGRKLLTAALGRFGYFSPDYCSKNFVFTMDVLDGHIKDYVQDRDKFYRKFFISKDCEKFFDTIYSFKYERFDHKNNIHNLENRLAESFLNVVSETMSTSYVPFVTEKFLYSIVTRGLFLAYAQPGWHAHLETYYGFKPYTKLFDYKFDSIENPVERLIALMSMISKFSILSADELKDLYLIEQDTIEYNYDHYFSQDYLKCLVRCATQKNCD